MCCVIGAHHTGLDSHSTRCSNAPRRRGEVGPNVSGLRGPPRLQRSVADERGGRCEACRRPVPIGPGRGGVDRRVRRLLGPRPRRHRGVGSPVGNRARPSRMRSPPRPRRDRARVGSRPVRGSGRAARLTPPRPARLTPPPVDQRGPTARPRRRPPGAIGPDQELTVRRPAVHPGGRRPGGDRIRGPACAASPHQRVGPATAGSRFRIRAALHPDIVPAGRDQHPATCCDLSAVLDSDQDQTVVILIRLNVRQRTGRRLVPGH